jgi:probable rRNA maturation factor
VSVDINNESGRPADETALLSVSRHVLSQLRIHPQAELAIQLVDIDTMEQLHVRYMDEPGPTDVLSFPMDELRPGSEDKDPVPGLLGDVVLCPEVAEKQAASAGHSPDAELALLCTHGILHLLGYDHADPEEEKEMFGLQRALLSSWQEECRRVGGLS